MYAAVTDGSKLQVVQRAIPKPAAGEVCAIEYSIMNMVL